MNPQHVALLLLLMFAGAASATDYYVSTTGDNTTSGNITHPWQNVSYAAQQADAGDTIHLFDGVWYSEVCVFANSGNATHPITLTAYNGTPEMDGQDTTFTDQYNVALDLGDNNYINIDGLHIHHYFHTIDSLDSYCKISNCVLHDTGGSLPSGQYGGVLVELSTHNDTGNTIENCTLSYSGWNSIQMSGYHTAGKYAMNHTVRNCTIHNSNKHGGISMYGNFKNVLIEGNTLENSTYPGIGVHGINDHMQNITLRNNTLNGDGGSTAMFQNAEHTTLDDLTLHNNTFLNIKCGNCFSIYLANITNNVIITDNKFYNCSWAMKLESLTYNYTISNNFLNSDVGRYALTGAENVTISYLLGYKGIRSAFGNDMLIKYDDNTVFKTQTSYDAPASTTPVRYHPEESNFSLTSTGGGITDIAVTTYNITLTPTNSYLKDVTVNHESDTSDDRTNISVNSSVSTNPAWINATMQNSSNTYNVSVDGGYVTQVVSDANKIVRYQYTSSWSSHMFEFDWYSDAGFSGAPDPTSLQSTKSSTWVHHTWSAGSGNVTDSYNVSVNSVWHNITNAYYNDTGLSAEDWSNITVWAFNNTGGISQNSISQNIQTDSAGWTPSNTAMYYNVSSTITIMTKTDGTNLFSRTPTQADGNATSGRMVVRTS